MDKVEFKKILFKVAFCTMACDGDIDDREVEEMKIMDKKTSFFESIDLSDELEHLLNELNNKGSKIITDLFEELKKHELNTIQELILLEVALRIINADEKHDENEIKFIHLLRAKLKVHDETINDRFGNVDILYTNEYSKNIITEKTDNEFIKSIKLPELTALKNIDLNIDEKRMRNN